MYVTLCWEPETEDWGLLLCFPQVGSLQCIDSLVDGQQEMHIGRQHLCGLKLGIRNQDNAGPRTTRVDVHVLSAMRSYFSLGQALYITLCLKVLQHTAAVRPEYGYRPARQWSHVAAPDADDTDAVEDQSGKISWEAHKGNMINHE
eukprot:s5276_g1.t1